MNKYEDTLKEHDDRLAELSGIEGKVQDSQKSIQGLQSMLQASTYANNSVIITEEAKQIGTFFNTYIFQKGYKIVQEDGESEGYIILKDAIIAYDGHYKRHLVDVKCFVHVNEWEEYSMPGYGGIVIEHRYNPASNFLEIHYKGMGNARKKIFYIIVQYMEETV